MSPPVPSGEWACPSLPSPPVPGGRLFQAPRSQALCAGYVSFLPPGEGPPPAGRGLLVGESHLFRLWPSDIKTGGDTGEWGAHPGKGLGPAPATRSLGDKRLLLLGLRAPSPCPGRPGALECGPGSRVLRGASRGWAGAGDVGRGSCPHPCTPCLAPWCLTRAHRVRGYGLSDVIRLVAALVPLVRQNAHSL